MSAYDVVVVGGGAAGLSAALVLGRACRTVAVVDAGQPRNAPAAHMHGYLTRDGLAPEELHAIGRRETESYGVHHLSGTVSSVARTSSGFRTTISGRQPIHARRVLVTTGLRDQIPSIPGADECWGVDLLHCPYCHGYEVRGQPLGVLGGTPGAVEHALLLRTWSTDVVFFPHLDDLEGDDGLRLAACGIDVVRGAVTRLVTRDGHLWGVELDNAAVVPRTAAFVKPPLIHNDGLLIALGAAVTAGGSVAVDQAGRTSVDGVWAAGNAVNPRAQVITAAGEGSAAAIAINADLVQEDTRRAVRAHHPLTHTKARTNR